MWGYNDSFPDYAYCRRLNRIVLFLDDLEDVLCYLKRNCTKVQLRADTGVADEGVDDLLDATRRELRRLSIYAVDPDIVVKLGTAGAYVATFDKTKKSRQIVRVMQNSL